MDSRAASRIRGFGTSVFTEMSRLAVQNGAVNLGQGFPDFPGPDFVKDAAKRAIDGDLNQYAPSHGSLRLRTAIAHDWRERFGRTVDPEIEVTVTSGATEAIFDLIQAFITPGDGVVTFEPFYDSYPTSVQMAGGVFRPVTLHPPDWRFDRDELRTALASRPKLLLLNTPHNPTGKVFSREELGDISELCREYDVLVLTDEVYDRILFDGAIHQPMAMLPGMWERTLTINSTGKTFSMTGWKIGYVVGPTALQVPLRAVHQFVTFATATPFQDAMASAMEQARGNGYYDRLQEEYQQRRDALATVLTEVGWAPFQVAGSYFLSIDVSELPFADDVAFCRWLTTEIGVAAIPTAAFYASPGRAPNHARFCFAKQAETIAEAGRRLANVPAALDAIAR